MSQIISQSEANELIAMEKFYRGNEEFIFPALGGHLSIPLSSFDNVEEFTLDITRGKIELTKNTLQNRGKTTIILVRLDIGGPPHRNPDDQEISCPHIHIYREGYADKWAQEIPIIFTDPINISLTLQQFFDYCNVVERPQFEQELFI